MTMRCNGEASACATLTCGLLWRRICAVIVAIGFLAAAGGAWAEDPGFPAPTGDTNVLPAGVKLDPLFDGACRLTEGVATGPDGMVYFSDITFSALCKDPSGKYPQAGNIWKYDPKTKQATIFRSPSGMSNGMKFDTPRARTMAGAG